MRKGLLAFLLVAVPLVVVPWAVTFDAAKACLLAAGVLVLAAWALPGRTPAGRGRFDLRWSPVSIGLAAAWLALAASAWRSPDPWAAADLLALLLAAGTFALAVENALLDPGELGLLLRAVAWTQGIVAAYGLLQAAGIDFPFPWLEGGRTLPVSTLGNPNFAAEWVAAALPFAVLAALRARGGGRAAAILGVLLGAGFLVAARGRAALLLGLPCGAAAAAALALGAAGGTGRHVAGGLLAAGAAAGLLAGAAGILASDGELPSFLGRSDTALVRVELARGTGRMLLDHPLGVGAGGWEAAHPPYRTEREYRASLFRDPGEAHCDPLQFAAEGGWPLVAAALALAGLLVATALRAAGPKGDRGMAIALAASLAATAGASLASAPFHRPGSLLLAAFAAGGLAFLGGGRTTTQGIAGLQLHRLLVLLLGASTILLGLRMAAEGPRSEGRRIEREEDPLPRERADAARGEFARAAALDPGAVDALAREGEISLKLGASSSSPAEARADYERARDRFERIGVLRPFDPMAISNLAGARAGLGEAAAAEADWRRALAVAPWHRNANQAFAYFLSRNGRAGEALHLAEAALAEDPAYAPAVGTRAEILADLGMEAEARTAASEGLDRILAARDLQGAWEASRRASAASPVLAAMLSGKATRLLGGPDPQGGRAVLYGVVAARPEEDLLERGAQALSAAKLHDESVRMRVEARLASSEAALRDGDREKAAREALRAEEIPLSTEGMRETRVRIGGLLVRAGRREEALAALGAAVARGFAGADALAADPAWAPLRDDPAFRALLAKARRNAEK